MSAKRYTNLTLTFSCNGCFSDLCTELNAVNVETEQIARVKAGGFNLSAYFFETCHDWLDKRG